MKDKLFSDDGKFLLWNNRKIRTGQSYLVFPEGKLNNFSELHKYLIDDEVVLKHFVVLLGMNVIINNDLEYKRLMRKLHALSSVIDRYNEATVYCIAEYTDPDNWIARKLDSNGILLESSLICKDGIIS